MNQYTRLITIPLGIVQSIGVLALLRSQNILLIHTFLDILLIIGTMVGGTMLVMWLGELITQYGIGNGISMLILGGIVARMPVSVLQTAATSEATQFTNILMFVLIGLIVIAAIVVMELAVRKVPIHYARRVRGSRTTGGQNTHLPLRLNQAGVIPIIFAVSLVLVPSLIGQFLTSLSNPQLVSFGASLSAAFNPQSAI